jgi:amino acid transporter
MEHEKTIPGDEKAIHSPVASSEERPHDVGEDWRQESFMTRNGMNLTSFKRRPAGGSIVVLDKKMKTRHLHMIAIGGSIGAGFFVGSGKALANGVSLIINPFIPEMHHSHTFRVLPRSSLTSRSWVS